MRVIKWISNMEDFIIIFGAIVVFCIGFLIGFAFGNSDRIIINHP
jgi:hypothetical protein